MVLFLFIMHLALSESKAQKNTTSFLVYDLKAEVTNIVDFSLIHQEQDSDSFDIGARELP